jgi:hypothetical protein
MTDHPITPTPELLQQWIQQGRNCIIELDALKAFATQVARWGADQELEACCEWVKNWLPNFSGGAAEELLRTARRPKPPSLKEQALDILGYPTNFWTEGNIGTIRRALEALPDD